jgi:hypothetical protein
MYAKRESRTLGNVGETLIEWALLQLRKAGSTEKLLRRPVPVRNCSISRVSRSFRTELERIFSLSNNNVCKRARIAGALSAAKSGHRD